jgi:hypothetical protein
MRRVVFTPPAIPSDDELPPPDDLHTMVQAWLSGSPAQRAVALDLADRNRRAAASTRPAAAFMQQVA